MNRVTKTSFLSLCLMTISCGDNLAMRGENSNASAAKPVLPTNEGARTSPDAGAQQKKGDGGFTTVSTDSQTSQRSESSETTPPTPTGGLSNGTPAPVPGFDFAAAYKSSLTNRRTAFADYGACMAAVELPAVLSNKFQCQFKPEVRAATMNLGKVQLDYLALRSEACSKHTSPQAWENCAREHAEKAGKNTFDAVEAARNALAAVEKSCTDAVPAAPLDLVAINEILAKSSKCMERFTPPCSAKLGEVFADAPFLKCRKDKAGDIAQARADEKAAQSKMEKAASEKCPLLLPPGGNVVDALNQQAKCRADFRDGAEGKALQASVTEAQMRLAGILNTCGEIPRQYLQDKAECTLLPTNLSGAYHVFPPLPE